jgi:RNA polymerase sigma factor (sigma-70 family)
MSALEHEITDERLARSLSAGDAAAFDELYRRYARRLSAYGARLLGDTSAGEDVAQIALFNAYQALCRGSEPAHVRAWLFRIAQNAALEILSRRRQLVEFSEEHHPSADPQELSAARGALIAALGTLPERQRSAYLLREVRGLRISEIAERLSLGTEQVEQALFAARNRLAEHLSFGDDLDCETARGLGSGGLHRTRQRALKRHLRSCVACRTAAPRRRRVGLLTPLAGLRDALAWLLGGASASAAKVGAVAAAAAVAVGTPVLGGDAPTQAATAPIGGPPAYSIVAEPPDSAVPLRRAAPKPQPPPAAPARVASPPAPVAPAPAPVAPVEEEAFAPSEPEEQAPAADAEEPAPAEEEYAEEEYVDQAPVEEEFDYGQDEPVTEEEPVAEEEEPVAEEEPVDPYGEENGETGEGEQPKTLKPAQALKSEPVTPTAVGTDATVSGTADHTDSGTADDTASPTADVTDSEAALSN